jgi:hypothetical protein
MSGADKLSYDSTGAGEMVKSHAGEVMGGWTRQGYGTELPSSGGGVDGVGNTGGNAEGGPLPSAGGSAGGFAKPGGHQDASGDRV